MNTQLTIPIAIRRAVARAIKDFSLLNKNDRVLIGLSGGKDSLTLVHVFRFLARITPAPFTFATATVDYQNPRYCPQGLADYLEPLGIKHYLISEDIVGMARTHMKKNSYTAFSSRIRRGILYNLAREKDYNVIALAQHADDILTSFFMSLWFEGSLQTMKASYIINNGDLRVIRPLCYAREQWMKDFADTHRLPVVPEEPPLEFKPSEERGKTKDWLMEQDRKYPQRLNKMIQAIKPLLFDSFYD